MVVSDQWSQKNLISHDPQPKPSTTLRLSMIQAGRVHLSGTWAIKTISDINLCRSGHSGQHSCGVLSRPPAGKSIGFYLSRLESIGIAQNRTLECKITDQSNFISNSLRLHSNHFRLSCPLPCEIPSASG